MRLDHLLECIGERELRLWGGLWKALLDLCPEVEEGEVLATCLTSRGKVVVTAGLVREMKAGGYCNSLAQIAEAKCATLERVAEEETE